MVEKLTIYLLPPDRFSPPADEAEFIGAIKGIFQVLPEVEGVSSGSFLLQEKGVDNIGRVATFRFKVDGRDLGTLLVVVAARNQILKFRATYSFADREAAKTLVSDSLTALLGQAITLHTEEAT